MRRGAARSAAAKVRLGTNDRSSPSPFVGGSDNGDSDNESVSSKKAKRELKRTAVMSNKQSLDRMANGVSIQWYC